MSTDVTVAKDSTTTKDKDENNNNDTETMKPASPNSKGAKQGNAATFKLLLLVLMVLQNSSTVLVGRHTRSSVKEEDLYVVNHLILITEVGKVCSTCYSVCLLLVSI